jgi:hypothetical protein
MNAMEMPQQTHQPMPMMREGKYTLKATQHRDDGHEYEHARQ